MIDDTCDTIFSDYYDYKILHDAYYGKGGFKYGTYIERYPREGELKYIRRRKVAYYSNYMRPIIDSHVDPIFRKEPKRSWQGNSKFDQFMEDVDACGAGMNRFMKKAALIAKIYGVAFIFTDNFAELPTNLAAALKERRFPYSYIVPPRRIESYKVNKFGKLTSITIREPAEDAEGNVAIGEWLREWTSTSWILIGSDGETKSQGEHNLGRLPVTPLYSNQVERLDTLPQSEFLDIAKMSISLYNRCSELDEILSSQTFNILIYPIADNQKPDCVQEIVTGVENVIGFYANGGSAPGYISPNSDPAEMQMKQIDRLVTEMYRMARLSHTTGVQKQTSGISKAYDFEQTNQNLGDFAANIEEAEEDIARIFALWENVDNIDYNVAYDRNFGIIDMTAILADATAALDLSIGNKFDAAVKKKIVANYLGEDVPPNEYDAIIKEIDDNGDNADYAEQSSKLAAARLALEQKRV
jgi:hypothetical protein